MMSETVIDKPVDDTDYGYKEMGSEARQKEVDSYVQSELGRDNVECGAIGCRRWCQKGTDWCPSHQSKENE